MSERGQEARRNHTGEAKEAKKAAESKWVSPIFVLAACCLACFGGFFPAVLVTECPQGLAPQLAMGVLLVLFGL